MTVVVLTCDTPVFEENRQMASVARNTFVMSASRSVPVWEDLTSGMSQPEQTTS